VVEWHGIDVRESLCAASTKPFGFDVFCPGPGVGAYCIPIDPSYLSHRVRSLGYQFKFVELARHVSNRMLAYVVVRVQGQLSRGARVKVGDPHLDRFDVDGVEIDLAQDPTRPCDNVEHVCPARSYVGTFCSDAPSSVALSQCPRRDCSAFLLEPELSDHGLAAGRGPVTARGSWVASILS
jgi:hypothetical protein